MAKNSYSNMTELIKDYYSMPTGTYLNQSVLINNVTLPCDMYKVEAETELTPSILTGCTEADANTQIIIGRDMSVESETTLIPPYRCKGIIIGDVGTFTNEGTISMTARGAIGEGKNIQLTPDYMISAVGGAGGSTSSVVGRGSTKATTNGKAGSSPASGIISCGGGGGGSAKNAETSSQNDRTIYGGAGSDGTSFSGGSGGGGGNTSGSGANATSNGGAGGKGVRLTGSWTTYNVAIGGAGNPKGDNENDSVHVMAGRGNGTGGLITILANECVNNGEITSNGVSCDYVETNNSGHTIYVAGGGSSGGGCVVLLTRKKSGTGTVSTAGGASSDNGGVGGAGTYSEHIIEDLILVDLPVEFAITDESHQSRITPSEAVRYLGLMDKDEFYYEIMGSRHRAMDTDMSFEDFDLPTGKVPSGHGNPVGTIINFFGESAPDGYLACDGTAYNIADYPTLAAHLLSFTDPTPYEVDGDDTKFKVPDLRGEFLRGSGTNIHTNQGSGADVGVHQDATEMADTFISFNNSTNSLYSIVVNPSSNNTQARIGNFDSTYRTSISSPLSYSAQLPSGDSWSETENNKGTVRPTNTSILYCIKY